MSSFLRRVAASSSSSARDPYKPTSPTYTPPPPKPLQSSVSPSSSPSPHSSRPVPGPPSTASLPPPRKRDEGEEEDKEEEDKRRMNQSRERIARLIEPSTPTNDRLFEGFRSIESGMKLIQDNRAEFLKGRQSTAQHFDRARDDMRTYMKNCDMKVIQVNQQLDNLQSQHKERVREYNDMVSGTEQLKKERDFMLRHTEEMKNALPTLAAQYNSLVAAHGDVTSVQQRLTQAQSDTENSIVRVKQQEILIMNLTASQGNLQEQVTLHQRWMDAMVVTHTKSLDEVNAQLQAERIQAIEREGKLQIQLVQANKALAESKDTVKTLQTQLVQATKALADSELTVKTLQTKRAHQTNSFAEKLAKISAESEERLKSLQSNLTKSFEEKLASKSAESEERLKGLQSEKAQMTKMYVGPNQTIYNLQLGQTLSTATNLRLTREYATIKEENDILLQQANTQARLIEILQKDKQMAPLIEVIIKVDASPPPPKIKRVFDDINVSNMIDTAEGRKRKPIIKEGFITGDEIMRYTRARLC